MAARHAVGLDIGTSGVRAAELALRNDFDLLSIVPQMTFESTDETPPYLAMLAAQDDALAPVVERASGAALEPFHQGEIEVLVQRLARAHHLFAIGKLTLDAGKRDIDDLIEKLLAYEHELISQEG